MAEPELHQWGLLLLNLAGAGIFAIKCLTIIFVQMWLRWTLPRPRIDQVLYACVKVLLPLSCVLLLGAALWQLLVPERTGVPWSERFPNPYAWSDWSSVGAGAALVIQVLLALIGLGIFAAIVGWVLYAA